MKRSTILIGVVMAILSIPAAQTVASALGIGLGPAGVDFAADVYANVSDAACGYSSDYDPEDSSFTAIYVCATTDHARLSYAVSDDETTTLPATDSGSLLWFYSYGCQRVLYEDEWGSYYGYECRYDSYAGSIPSDSFAVDPLLASGSIRATVETDQGSQCEIDLALDTPDGPTAGNTQWSNSDANRTVRVSMGSAINAAARSRGGMTGTACGTPTGPSTYAEVSRGAGLRVDVSASATPATPTSP